MFGKYIASESQPVSGGIQHKYQFENGYGASVIRHDYSYGGQSGLWELAVLGPNGHLTYDTPITNDVLGWLNEAQVAQNLDAIAALPMSDQARTIRNDALTQGGAL